jgi:hypothetical protein
MAEMQAVEGPIPVPLPAVIADSPLAILMLGPSLVSLYFVYDKWSSFSKIKWAEQVIAPLGVGYAAGYVVGRFFNQPPFIASLAGAAAAYFGSNAVSGWLKSMQKDM